MRFDGARRAAAARAGARPSERTRDRRAGAFETRRVRRWEKELLGGGVMQGGWVLNFCVLLDGSV